MIRRSQTKRLKMAASTSKLKTQACSDKNYYDEKKGHDVNDLTGLRLSLSTRPPRFWKNWSTKWRAK